MDRKIPNEEVWLWLQIENSYIVEQNKKLKMSFFGNIKPYETLEKVILEGKFEGKKKRGKPRKLWTDDIKNWQEISIKRAEILA